MPNFEFECTLCKQKSERIVKVDERDNQFCKRSQCTAQLKRIMRTDKVRIKIA